MAPSSSGPTTLAPIQVFSSLQAHAYFYRCWQIHDYMSLCIKEYLFYIVRLHFIMKASSNVQCFPQAFKAGCTDRL